MDITYNNITLANIHTQEWTQQLEYDPSGTDAALMRHRITVAAILHTSQLSASLGANFHQQLYNLRNRLLQPRKTLTITIGQSAWTITPELDCAAGPRPQDVSVQAIFGDQAVRVTFTVEFAWRVCESKKLPVLYHRWSINETVGEDHRIRRQVAGRLRLSSGENSPHLYRYLVFPPLEEGFARRRVTFRAPEDGLHLEYEFEDEQVSDAAPWPATVLDGNFTIHIDREAMYRATLDVVLAGPPIKAGRWTAKSLLFIRALQIVEDRLGRVLQVSLNSDKNDFFLSSAVMSERLGNRAEVRVSVTAMIGATNLRRAVQRLLVRFGQPLKLKNYDPLRSAVPPAWGYNTLGQERRPTVLALMHCLPHAPCQVPPLGTGQPRAEEKRPSGDRRIRSSQTRFYETDQSLSAPRLAPDVWKNADTKIYTLIRYLIEHDFQPLAIHLPRASDGRIERLLLTNTTAEVQGSLLRFEAERLGDWPQVPEPLLEGTYERGRRIRLHSPQSNPTHGVLAYRVTGESELVWQKALGRDEPLPVLRRPGTTKSLPEFSLEKYRFQA